MPMIPVALVADRDTVYGLSHRRKSRPDLFFYDRLQFHTLGAIKHVILVALVSCVHSLALLLVEL